MESFFGCDKDVVVEICSLEESLLGVDVAPVLTPSTVIDLLIVILNRTKNS
jgi:hypothetical protein